MKMWAGFRGKSKAGFSMTWVATMESFFYLRPKGQKEGVIFKSVRVSIWKGVAAWSCVLRTQPVGDTAGGSEGNRHPDMSLLPPTSASAVH